MPYTDEENLASKRRNLINVLMDEKKFADRVFRGGKVINVITAEIYEADIAVCGEYILRVGDCGNLIGPDTDCIVLNGAYIMPGLIDAHMHFESAMLNCTEFTRLSLPTGTTTLVADPHEIANVLGPAGVYEMARESVSLPNRIHTRVPCRIPDVPMVETSGVDITSLDVPTMLDMPTVDGIGEMQSVGAPRFVYLNTPEVFDDVLKSTIYARENGKVVDGNAAALFDDQLAAHIIASGTDISCHETTTKEETLEKIRYGVRVLMREGSTQRNMKECIRVITEDGVDPRYLCLATDDILPDDLRNHGHMNDVVRRTIAAGIDPVMAIQMATINSATWMGLHDVGVLAPGKLADLCIVTGELKDMTVSQVYVGGRLVACDNELTIDLPPYRYPDWLRSSVKRAPVTSQDLVIKAGGANARVRVVGLIPDQNLSEAIEATLPIVEGTITPDLSADIIHASVVERHGRHGGIANGFISGFGMKRGAIAETISHNTHNIIVMGTNAEDMAVAVNELIRMQGGIVLVDEGKIMGSLPLPIAGLINDEMTASEISTKIEDLTRLANTHFGITVHGPFMHLAFLSLSTSPVWKLTDRGLLNVETLDIIPVVIEQAETAA